jgi:hypothetical protein
MIEIISDEPLLHEFRDEDKLITDAFGGLFGVSFLAVWLEHLQHLALQNEHLNLNFHLVYAQKFWTADS